MIQELYLSPSDLTAKLTASYIKLELGLPDGVNPINRVEVIASEDGGTASLDMIPNKEDDVGAGGSGDETALIRSNTI